ncbi:MAG: polysaccharide pyruvyl transferase family protein [Pelobacteraceae bacterium]
MKIVVIGYYGMGNIGDDLMLRSLLLHFGGDRSVGSVTVVCNNNYYEPFPKTRFISSGISGKFKKLLALCQADLVCFGGGTCIGEQADNSGMFQLLQILKLCARLNVPFAFFAIGIGTVASHEIKRIALEILNRARYISFRDDDSLAVARNVLGFSGACTSCGDLAALGWRRLVTSRHSAWRGEISFSGVFGQTPEVAKHWGGVLATLVAELGVRINFLPAHSREKDDNRFHHQISLYLKPGSYIIHSLATPFEFIPILGRMDLHIGMRLHSVIIADILGIPNIAVEYSPKVAFYLRKSGVPLAPRLVQLKGHVNSERVQHVYATYKQPTAFLDAEEKAARESLEELLATF